MTQEPPLAAESAPGLLLALVLVGALAFRLGLIAWIDFPISDGALFYEFVRAVSDTFPGLPHFVDYNGIAIPFAYPPLSFWVGGFLVNLGVEPIEIVRVVPILVNAAYVLLFALLLLRAGHSRLFTALAILFFSLAFRSFEWLVMGGGLSRGFGALFLILALIAVSHRREGVLATLPATLPLIAAGVAVAAAILSHLEWGILAAAGVVLWLLQHSRGAKGFLVKGFLSASFVAGLSALVLVLPWFLAVYSFHGLEPFLAAGSTGNWTVDAVLGHFVQLGRRVLANPFILLGLFAMLKRRDFFWPGFALLCVVLTPRHAYTPVSLPFAVFAAGGVVAAYEILGRRFKDHRIVLGALLGPLGAVLALQTFLVARNVAGPTFAPLPPENRQAMNWVSQKHPGQSFAVVTAPPWHYDRSAEWFPTLAKARSITTVQGREWLPGGAFSRWQTTSWKLKGEIDCADLLRQLSSLGEFSYVWAEARQECFPSSAFAKVYEAKGLVILEMRGTAR